MTGPLVSGGRHLRPAPAMLHPQHSRRGRAGFTFIELTVVMVILLVALLIFSSTISGIARQRTAQRESALAQAAARNALESMRAEVFTNIFALYNEDPADDPGGAGTAPGNRFAIEGLDALSDDVADLEGEFRFPTMEDGVNGLELREDVDNRKLGMPRDLSGDNVVDQDDHGADYFILPVEIRVRWRGRSGTCHYELVTQLCPWNKA